MFFYYFSLEAALQRVAKNNPTEKKNGSRNLGAIEARASVETHRRENVKFIVTNCKEKFRL